MPLAAAAAAQGVVTLAPTLAAAPGSGHNSDYRASCASNDTFVWLSVGLSPSIRAFSLSSGSQIGAPTVPADLALSECIVDPGSGEVWGAGRALGQSRAAMWRWLPGRSAIEVELLDNASTPTCLLSDTGERLLVLSPDGDIESPVNIGIWRPGRGVTLVAKGPAPCPGECPEPGMQLFAGPEVVAPAGGVYFIDPGTAGPLVPGLEGLPALPPGDILVALRVRSELWLACDPYSGNCWGSVDRAQRWSARATLPVVSKEVPRFLRLARDSSAGNAVYALVRTGEDGRHLELFQSDDGARSWRAVPLSRDGDGRDLSSPDELRGGPFFSASGPFLALTSDSGRLPRLLMLQRSGPPRVRCLGPTE